MCKETKPFAEFNKNINKKDGHASECRPCAIAYKRAYRAKHGKPPVLRKKLTKEEITERQRKYRLENREWILEKRRLYRQANRHKDKAYREANKERDKAYRLANRERLSANNKQYKQENKKRLLEQQKVYLRERKQRDPLFALHERLRLIAWRAKSKFGISTRTAQLIGCSWEQAQAHLVQTALTRYGYCDDLKSFHVDHIIPLSSATTEAEAIALSHISNLQLLTPKDNLMKSNKLDHAFGEAV